MTPQEAYRIAFVAHGAVGQMRADGVTRYIEHPCRVAQLVDEFLRATDAGGRVAVQGFYDTMVDKTIAVSGTREAEMAKLLENTFRNVNAALVNEMATFARDLDVDIWEAIEAASTKPFGFLRT